MNFLVVFLGGGLGAILRHFLGLIIPKANCTLPFCTLAANFLACFIAGIVFSYFLIKSDLNSTYKLLLITGFCGGLSTFSTFSLEILNYIQEGSHLKALLYIIISLLICVMAVFCGIVLVKKIFS